MGPKTFTVTRRGNGYLPSGRPRGFYLIDGEKVAERRWFREKAELEGGSQALASGLR